MDIDLFLALFWYLLELVEPDLTSESVEVGEWERQKKDGKAREGGNGRRGDARPLWLF